MECVIERDPMWTFCRNFVCEQLSWTAAHRANKKRNIHMGSFAIDIFLNGLTQGCGLSHERKQTLKTLPVSFYV